MWRGEPPEAAGTTTRIWVIGAESPELAFSSLNPNDSDALFAPVVLHAELVATSAWLGGAAGVVGVVPVPGDGGVVGTPPLVTGVAVAGGSGVGVDVGEAVAGVRRATGSAVAGGSCTFVRFPRLGGEPLATGVGVVDGRSSASAWAFLEAEDDSAA